MRALATAVLAATVLFAPPALAKDRDDCEHSIDVGSSLEWPARWAPRHDTRLARCTITTRDGDVSLLLTSTAVAFQFSDDKMEHIERKLRNEQFDDDDSDLGSAIKTAVLAGVRVLLKHSAECPMRELRDVDYRGGRLVFVTRSGDRVFDQLEVNNLPLDSAFPEPEARAFVREFRKLKSSSR